MADLQIPPFRTPLTINGGNAPVQTDVRTAKEWYFYWRQTGTAIGALSHALRYGTHTDRLDAEDKPNGALWVETDRGNAIYEAQDDGSGGKRWVYVTGTMYGTLSPDQRPTDLRSFDAGFVYRTTDTDTAYAPREFIWSGAEWVETTRVLYGTHTARPVADEKTPARTLYVETDRGNVIYQQQANAWVYVSGAMRGTLSPDQRPAGLGTNDTGFRFIASDQQKEYAWTGAAWVIVSSQTPWASDIDGAGYRLGNAGNIGVGLAAASVPVSNPNANRHYITIQGSAEAGVLELATGGADADGTLCGQVAVSDPANSQTDKRMGAISVWRSGTTANNRGSFMTVYTRANGGTGLSERMRIDNLGNVGVGTAAPGYKLDVAGDVNISAGSSFRVNGTPISGGGISTQNIVTGSRALGGGPYTNGTGKPMMVEVTISANAGNGMAGYTDAGSATTVVAQTTNTGSAAGTICLAFWVLAGNVYKVTTGGGTLTTWVEWY